MSEQSIPAPVVYKEIPNHSGYRAGSDGSIWSCRSRNFGRPEAFPQWRKLVPLRLTKKDRRAWYKMYKLRADDGRLRCSRGSVFVLEAFVGPRPPGMEACHNDGDSTNDAPSNLRWDTHENNEADKVIHGSQRGQRNGNAKLTEDDVRQVKRLAAEGCPRKVLAWRFRVSLSAVHHIVTGLIWSHVT